MVHIPFATMATSAYSEDHLQYAADAEKTDYPHHTQAPDALAALGNVNTLQKRQVLLSCNLHY